MNNKATGTTGIILVCIMALTMSVNAQTESFVRFGSAEELTEQYILHKTMESRSGKITPTMDKNGIEYFVAQKRVNTYDAAYRIYKYDSSSFELTPLISDSAPDPYWENLSDMSVDKIGTRLVGSRIIEGNHTNVYIVDIQSGSINELVADGNRNYRPAISPDARFVAYFSADPTMGNDINAKHGTANILELSTGKTFKVAEPIDITDDQLYLQKPIWLSNESVVFSTLSTNLGWIKSQGIAETDLVQGKFFPSCPYLGLARFVDGEFETTYRLFPSGTRIIHFLTTSDNRLFIRLSDRHQDHVVEELDHNLVTIAKIVELPRGQRFKNVWIDKDELKYEYWTGVGRERASAVRDLRTLAE